MAILSGPHFMFPELLNILQNFTNEPSSFTKFKLDDIYSDEIASSFNMREKSGSRSESVGQFVSKVDYAFGACLLIDIEDLLR